jgi:hypothetical protein
MMSRCLGLRLQPWQKREPPAMDPDSAQEIAEAVSATRKYVAGQPKKLAEYLGVPAPTAPTPGVCPAYGAEAPESLEEPPADEPPVEEEEEGGEEEEEEKEEPEEEGEEPKGEQPGEQPEAPPATTPQASIITDVSPPALLLPEAPVLLLRVAQVELGRHGLAVQIKAPRAGRLQLSVSSEGSKLCSARRHIKKGKTTVACPLARPELEALDAHPRWFTIGARLKTDSGAKLECWKTLKSPHP